ncbi:hypothetical protein F4820DRAFT_271060 [Hypoxylon rubiginosum]|uniref:Uncharacterized protein n=1 Tax=Hypoxylon rubiginosum TaxID=110542 RepID=A0ACB9Z3H0_9PEZI|nr:hypothetical protein F4820DRAFT_271060 [Hypoxylon rubiginosum]
MSFGPQVVMPGAFHSESPNSGSLSGVHPGMFRPPISPSASNSLYLGRSSGSLYSDTPAPGPNIKRKRHRPTESTPLIDWSIGVTDAGLGADYAPEEKFDEERLIEQGGRRYVLAGQMDTPNGTTAAEIREAMEESVYSDVDYRRGLGPERSRAEIESLNYRYPTTTPSAPTRAQQRNGWGLALNKIGGVVGKVFQFCTGAVFRGFYAGGGRGYEMRGPSTPSRQPSPNGQVWCNEHDVPTLPDFSTCATPGGFPQNDYTPSLYGRGTPESTPPPAAKRRHISEIHGDELRNWVVVREPVLKPRPQSRASLAPTRYTSNQQSYPPVLHRRINKPISRVNSPSIARRQSSRISHAGSATLSRQEPASFASPRSQSPAPSYYPSRIPIPVPSRPQSPSNVSPTRLPRQSSLIPSPNVSMKRGHRRNHSTASAASVTSNRARRCDSVQGFEDDSPRLDAEAKNLAAKRLHEEIETDLRMNDFNARIRDMIRQGKEALGTTVEVEVDSGDCIDPWEDE